MSNLIAVDRGALRMALNMLERHGCNEGAKALSESCVDLRDTERLEFCLLTMTHERDAERAKSERIMAILMGIHNLLDPEPVTVDDKTYVFSNPMAAKVLHELSKRIRAIPEAIAGVTHG